MFVKRLTISYASEQFNIEYNSLDIARQIIKPFSVAILLNMCLKEHLERLRALCALQMCSPVEHFVFFHLNKYLLLSLQC